MNLISHGVPSDWHELQEEVAQILGECGMRSAVDVEVKTARGSVKVDVVAEDNSRTPPVVILCECKLWKQSVRQSVVHSFRTVVNDSGASLGLVISPRRAQRGAYEATEHSNVRVLSWAEFQAMFEERWTRNYLLTVLSRESHALVEYTQPILRIKRKARNLPPAERAQFAKLRKRHVGAAFFAMAPCYASPEGKATLGVPQLPIRTGQAGLSARFVSGLPASVVAASYLRDFLDVYVSHLHEATAEFDALFGERA